MTFVSSTKSTIASNAKTPIVRSAKTTIVRSANTGISAIINARGEIIKKTKYNTKAVLVGEISPRSELTFYSIYGDLIGRWAIFISGILMLIAISGRLKKT